jgi:hypothetical protein
MKNAFLFVLVVSVTMQPAFADFADSIAKVIFQKKVDEVYTKTQQCSPLERDAKASMDASDWIKIQPPLPQWQKLAEIETVAKEATTYARLKGRRGKHLHCLAGCYVAKKLDYKSAVLVGWYKELSDASDCSKTTTFEKKDYDATVTGANGGKSPKPCELFCKNP